MRTKILTLGLVFILTLSIYALDQKAENLKTFLALSTSGKYKIPSVQIANGRAKGGERVAIITLIDSTKKGEIGKVGGIFGAISIYHKNKLDNFDSVAVVIGDVYKKTRGIIVCQMKDIQDFRLNKITAINFIKKWIVTMRASNYLDKEAKLYGWQ